MKKLLLSITAFAALMACSKDDIVEQKAQLPITFGNAFVDNSTRVPIDNSYTTDKLDEFEVYGTITGSQQNGGGTANIFKQESVTKNTDGNWGYAAAKTQYWIAGNTYNFVAIADGNVESATQVETGTNDMPTAIKVLDASKQKDILYAEQKNVTYAASEGQKSIAFTFSHLMAKAKFTVNNTIEYNNGYSYKVSDVKITNAAKTSTYTINTGWGTSSETYELGFGNIVAENATAGAEAVNIPYQGTFKSNYERLLIPTNVANDAKSLINVEFTYDLFKDGVKIDHQTKTLGTELKIKKGYAYNFVINLGAPGEQIKFTVSAVETWVTDHDNDGDDEDDNVEVK